MPDNTSTVGNPYLFTGRRYDPESGLYYYRQRHYDPTAGRFVQRDPMGMWHDEINVGNAHNYVGCNPVNLVDPFGLRQPTKEESKLMREIIKIGAEQFKKQPARSPGETNWISARYAAELEVGRIMRAIDKAKEVNCWIYEYMLLQPRKSHVQFLHAWQRKDTVNIK